MIIIVPITMDLTAYRAARIYRDHMWSKHRLPRKVISDIGPQFMAQFMKDLHKLTGVTAYISTAYHPQMDRQTEPVNQEIEQYLWIFINHRPSYWADWLACAEFSYNNKVCSSMGFSPIYIMYGRHPNMGSNPRRQVRSHGVAEFAKKMEKIDEETKSALMQVQEL
jgi:hypothetical protein